MRCPGSTCHATTVASADCVTTERIGSPSAGCRKSALLKMRGVVMRGDVQEACLRPSACGCGVQPNDCPTRGRWCALRHRPLPGSVLLVACTPKGFDHRNVVRGG